MSFDPEKWQGYIKQLQNIREELKGEPFTYTFASVDRQLASVFDTAKQEQPEFDNVLWRYQNKCIILANNGQSTSVIPEKLKYLRTEKLAAYDELIEVAQNQLRRHLEQANNVNGLHPVAGTASSSTTQPFQEVRNLQAQLDAVIKERDKAQEGELKLAAKCNELRRDHAELLSQLEQKQAAKLTDAQAQYLTQLQQAEQKHSGQVADIRNEFNATQDRLKGQISDLLQALQGARNALSQARTEKDKAEQETAKVKEQAASDAASIRVQVEELERRPGVSSDPQRVRDGLEEAMSELPSGLQAFAQGLLRCAGGIEAGHAYANKAAVAPLEEFVYSPPPAYGRLIEVDASPASRETLRAALMQITALQAWAHQELNAQGVRVINPAVGQPFDSRRHAAAEADWVWINDRSERNNQVAGVKRLGFEVNGSVVSKAQIKRFVFAGMQGAAAENGNDTADEPPSPQAISETGEAASRVEAGSNAQDRDTSADTKEISTAEISTEIINTEETNTEEVGTGKIGVAETATKETIIQETAALPNDLERNHAEDAVEDVIASPVAPTAASVDHVAAKRKTTAPPQPEQVSTPASPAYQAVSDFEDDEHTLLQLATSVSPKSARRPITEDSSDHVRQDVSE